MTIRLLGLDLFDLEITTQDAEEDTARDLSGGTTVALPVGFVAQPGDQRWEQGVEAS